MVAQVPSCTRSTQSVSRPMELDTSSSPTRGDNGMGKPSRTKHQRREGRTCTITNPCAGAGRAFRVIG